MKVIEQREEHRVRKLATRQGYVVRKSRAPISIDNFGAFMLVDLDTNGAVLGNRFEASLDDIAGFLRQEG